MVLGVARSFAVDRVVMWLKFGMFDLIVDHIMCYFWIIDYVIPVVFWLA